MSRSQQNSKNKNEQAVSTKVNLSMADIVASAMLGAAAYLALYLVMLNTRYADKTIFAMFLVVVILGFLSGILANLLLGRHISKDSVLFGFGVGIFLVSGIIAVQSSATNSLVGLALFSLVIGAAFRYAFGYGTAAVAFWNTTQNR